MTIFDFLSFPQLTGTTGFLVRPFPLSLDILFLEFSSVFTYPGCSEPQLMSEPQLRLFLWIICANALWCRVASTRVWKAGEGKVQDIGCDPI